MERIGYQDFWYGFETGTLTVEDIDAALKSGVNTWFDWRLHDPTDPCVRLECVSDCPYQLYSYWIDIWRKYHG